MENLRERIDHKTSDDKIQGSLSGSKRTIAKRPDTSKPTR